METRTTPCGPAVWVGTGKKFHQGASRKGMSERNLCTLAGPGAFRAGFRLCTYITFYCALYSTVLYSKVTNHAYCSKKGTCGGRV